MIRALCGALVAVLALALPAVGGEAPSAARAQADSREDVEHVPGRLVVRYRPGHTVPAGLLAELGVTGRTGTRIPGVVTLDLPETASERVRRRLTHDPRVLWVDRDVVVRAADTEPDDPLWSQQWGPQMIGAAEAWDHSTGSPSVTVAVLDTGVDATHPDLLGRVRTGWSTVTGTPITQDDNPLGHGTAATGVLAAEGDNGLYLAGMCWTCSILPVKVLNAIGVGDTTQLAEGIVWAVDNGADIINMSLGADRSPQVLDDAVAHAVSEGVLLVAAAGNSDSTEEFYPAADDRVLSVGATDRDDTRYSFSNYSWVEVAAPGCNVATTPLATFTLSFCGTSSAAPLVTGTAALILAHTPSATPEQIRSALERTAVPVDGFVHGRINAAAALNEFVSLPASPEPTPTPGPGPSPEQGQACPEDRVPDAGFRDIRGNTHEHPINCIVWYGVARGISEDRYGPELAVSRAQMASFIARALERAGVRLSASGGHFDDTANSPHRENIDKLANAGVVQGTGPRTYSPHLPVRRDQMASFLVRAYELAADEQLQASRSHFNDTRGNTHEHNIDKAAEAGLVRGTSPRTYSPALDVRRDQMGSFIARTLDLLVARGHMEPN